MRALLARNLWLVIPFMSQADDNHEFISGARAHDEPNFVAGKPAMLPGLLLAAGLTIGVMAPLIWVAFDVVEPASETIHSDAATAAAPEVPTSGPVLPATSSKQPIETTIGAASDGQESASASPAVASPPIDLNSERPSPPSPAKPTLPQASDKEAVPPPVTSEEAKPRSAEASDKAAVPGPVISEEAKARPAEVKEAAPPPAASEETKLRSAEAFDKAAVPAPVISEEAKARPADVKEAVPPPATSEEAKLRSAEAVAPTGSVMPPMEKTEEPKSSSASTSSTSSIQTSAETAPAGRPSAPASPSVDLEPSPARPSPPQASDKEAVSAPGASEEAKPRSAEAATPGVSASRQVETPRKARPHRSARTSRTERTRASANEVRSRKTVHRARPRDRADWVAVLRDTGWLGSGRRH